MNMKNKLENETKTFLHYRKLTSKLKQAALMAEKTIMSVQKKMNSHELYEKKSQKFFF